MSHKIGSQESKKNYPTAAQTFKQHCYLYKHFVLHFLISVCIRFCMYLLPLRLGKQSRNHRVTLLFHFSI